MPPANALCENCEKIPFSIEGLRDGVSQQFSLGSLERVRMSACFFCTLVSTVVDEDIRLLPSRNWQQNDEIELRWLEFSGPAGAGRFEIYGISGNGIGFVRASAEKSSVAKGYHLSPKLDSELDYQRVRSWLSSCRSTHDGNCNIKPARREIASNYAGLKLLRLIDVEGNCIVETESLYPYMALSYVWGNIPNFRLTRRNKATLMKPGALHDYKSQLPKTIQDAIELVRRMGERYLWVDSLCLQQNDPDDLKSGVDAMDLIYEKALLTIVAACGSDANAGLPGVGYGTRVCRDHSVEVAPNTKLSIDFDLDLLLKAAPYSSRAWTFQEALLSRRVLYFVDNKIFFRCRSATFSEQWHHCTDKWQKKPDSTWTSLLPGAVHLDFPMSDFDDFLLYYSQRALSYQADVLRAMAGIIRRVSTKMCCRFFEGLPTATFDHNILFRKLRSLLHRRYGFPSYSWTGWRGSLSNQTMIDPDANQWLSDNTWIIWFKRSPGGVLNLVWDPMANEEFPFHDEKSAGYRTRRPFRPPVPLPFSVSRIYPTEHLQLTCDIPEYPILQFWSLATYFRIVVTDAIQGSASIIDHHDTDCGALLLDGFEELLFFESVAPFELIILSECVKRDWEKGGIPISNKMEGKFYNVMLLEWSQGLAERRGIGWLEQTAIVRGLPPGPIWKEIVLG